MQLGYIDTLIELFLTQTKTREMEFSYFTKVHHLDMTVKNFLIIISHLFENKCFISNFKKPLFFTSEYIF